jgi:hypothetical protein
MTKWLERLTSHDLSDVDARGLKSIDQWLELLDERGMFVFHSTGTSGKLSFYPRSQVERPVWIEANWKFLELLSPDIRSTKLPVFWPAYRSGRQAGTRLIAEFGPLLAGDAANFHALSDEPMSADFMALAMRLRRAQQTGDLKAMDMIRGVVKTRGELLTMRRKRPQMIRDFFSHMVKGYRGRRVFLMAAATDLLAVAQEGLSEGIEQIFAPDSVLLTGGGFKGQEEVADWQNVLKRFYGVGRVHLTYGMTELSAYNLGCDEGHYHVLPWSILFLVDPATGQPLPRRGTRTGRVGFFDLLAQTYWGGTLSGDIATVHFGEQCGCGWQGVFIEDSVHRLADESGEDRVSCAAVQDAYTTFLTEDLEV